MENQPEISTNSTTQTEASEPMTLRIMTTLSASAVIGGILPSAMKPLIWPTITKNIATMRNNSMFDWRTFVSAILSSFEIQHFFQFG